MRLALLASTLARRGHDVTWWASAFNHLRKSWAFPADADAVTDDGVHIRALHGIGYPSNLSPRRVLDYRIVARKFSREAPAAAQPDVIVASMPGYDLAAEAVRFGRARGVPVIVDVRDQWPESFADPLPSLLRPIGLAALAGETRLMRQGLAGADALVSMCESLLEWGLQQARRDRSDTDRVYYLGGHAPSPGTQPASAALRKALERARGKFIVAFVGTFARYHNPSLLVEAARRLGGERFHFILGGDGELRDAIAQAADGVGHVDLPGWLGQSDVDALLLSASAGACPTDPSISRPFFPNKIFAYLGAGLPVVSAFPGEVQAMIVGHGIGYHYANIEELVAALGRLADDEGARAQMSASARALFSDRFDAARTYDAYADHVERIAATRRRNPIA